MPDFQLSFFNTFRVQAQGEAITQFRSSKTRGLLIYLILEANTAHPRTKLATLLWPDDSAEKAKHSLRQALYHLRRVFGNIDSQGRSWFITTRQTIQFNQRCSYEIDVESFLDAIGREDLDAAETLYAGQLLPSFTCDSYLFEEWLTRKRDAYQQAALTALHDLAERQLELGEKAISKAQLLARRQLDLVPWREEAHRQLMRALALTGDRSAAITQFDTCSNILADELGVSPTPETFDLFEAIRDGAYPPVATLTRIAAKIPNNIPYQATSFVGRSAEIDQIVAFLHNPKIRLITIVAPGGMGKTRLALETARYLLDYDSAPPFTNGIFLVELAQVATHDQIIPAIASTFGFAIERKSDPLRQIINFMSNKRLLLLLDNFEHLLTLPSKGAAIVAEILRAVSHTKIVATSRQKLHLSSEHVFALGGLTIPQLQSTKDAQTASAIQLFVQSAQRIAPNFELTQQNLRPITQICRLTAGMPLGILLTAAWVDTLSVAEISAEMQTDIDFLAAEMADLPLRQRSMRAVFQHSWALLSRAEQQIVSKLSVFRGGFTREAAQAVSNATLRQLSALLNKSLIQHDVNPNRFTLHQFLRQLAAEKLEQEGNVRQVHNIHSDYYMQFMAEHGQHIIGQQQQKVISTLRREHQNIQSAWLWSVKQRNVRPLLPIVELYYRYFSYSGQSFEAERFWRDTLALLPSGELRLDDTENDVTFLRACILSRLQYLGFQRLFDKQSPDLDQLYAYFDARGAKLEMGFTCQHLGVRALQAQDFAKVAYYSQERIRLYEEANDIARLAVGLEYSGYLFLRVGQPYKALTMLRRSTALSRQSNDRFTLTNTSLLLTAFTLYNNNNYNSAQKQFAQIEVIAREMWLDGLNSVVLTNSLMWQGFLALLQGNLDRAQAFAQKIQEVVIVRNQTAEQNAINIFQSLVDATAGTYKVIEPEVLEITPISHIMLTNISITLNACGMRNMAVTTRFCIKALSNPMIFNSSRALFDYVPFMAFVFAEHGQFSRAATLLATARSHPVCPHGWWDIMILIQELEARLQVALSPDDYADAQAAGQKTKIKSWVPTLLAELQTIAEHDDRSQVMNHRERQRRKSYSPLFS